MTSQHLRDRSIEVIRGWQLGLDTAIARAGRCRLEKLEHLPNLAYDLRQATNEAWALGRGNDLRYDRPTTGLLYGSWYHPQRLTTCLPQVLDSLIEADLRQPLEVYDLGAGTGAFQWAFALAAAALRQVVPRRQHRIHFVNLDSSAIMLQHLEDLWGCLGEVLPEVTKLISHEVSINSYTGASTVTTAQRWLTASYLFDHTDKVEDVAFDFVSLINAFEPKRVLLSTSSAKGRKYFPSILMNVLSQVMTPLREAKSIHREFFEGQLPQVNQLRQDLASVAAYSEKITDNVKWRSTRHQCLTLANDEGSVGSGATPAEVNIEMFRPELPPRNKIELSPEQEEACKLGKQPTAVFGPAGSGKSVILSERIKRLVEERDYDFSLRILVTTFNKKLVTEVLGKWLKDLLEPTRFYHGSADDGVQSFSFRDRDGKRSGVANIQLFNFDKLPTRIAYVHNGEFAKRRLFGENEKNPDLTYEGELFETIQAAVDEVRGRLREDFDTTEARVKHVLNARYVEEDLHRVVYGLGQDTKTKFLGAESRPGRGRTVQRGGKPRKVLWAAIERYVKQCSANGIDSFLTRRVRLRHRLDAGYHRNLYTHVFVDELQDCGDADFSIFYSLVRDPNDICVTGDLAQAVHLGKSSSSALPRYNHFFGEDGHPRDKVTKQSNWRYVGFKGSYRLPFRISEALIPLSEKIAGTRATSDSDAPRDGEGTTRDANRISVVLQHPYKGSPPGVRIIVVSAEDDSAMATKIRVIRGVYCRSGRQLGFGESPPVIMERDEGLQVALGRIGVQASTDTILRLKGLEYEFVIWSTRASIPAEDDHAEYAYTILTRTSGMAVIALFPGTSVRVQEVLGTFKSEEIICWDEVSAAALAECRT